jgi:hypothetical protein
VVQQCLTGHVGVHPGFAGQVADTSAAFPKRRSVTNGGPEELGVTPGWVVEAEQQANGGGLPGPVWTQKTEHLAILDGEREAVDGVDVAVGFREVGAGNRRHTGTGAR